MGARTDGVRIRNWPETGPADVLSLEEIPDGAAKAPEGGRSSDTRRRVVVSAFGCELPAQVRSRLAPADGGQPPPLWVNLEYLSAEDWVEGCHGLASIKPSDGAVEHFFYPGFTPATGGLLRERGLLQARADFEARGEAGDWLAAHRLSPAPGERLLSLFCYPDAPASDLFGLLAVGAQPSRVLVPEGIALAEVEHFLGAPLPVGGEARRGQLCLQRFGLLDQDGYDRLLWSCDLNFVRGEDSWIRAHWARRPFVWQPYTQAEDTHLAKLEAFLSAFQGVAGPATEAAEMMRAWSGQGPLAIAWPAFSRPPDSPAGEAQACAYARWSDHLAGQRDLASSLVEFCRNRL